MGQSTTFHSALSRAPMLRLVLPFAAGLVIARSIDSDVRWPAVFAVVAAVGWIVISGQVRSYPHRWLRGALLVPVLIALGVCWGVLRSPLGAARALSIERRTVSCWSVRITEVISSNERVARAWARVEGAVDSTGARPAAGGVLLTLQNDSTSVTPAPGDVLLLQARVDTIVRVPDPGGFDQRAWAASYGVYHQCFAPSGQWRVTRAAAGFASIFEGGRRMIVRWLEHSALDARERGMVKAILLGIRDDLDADQKAAFARSGTMHVLAVSGSHVALIYGALLWAFKPLGERKRWKVARSVIILLVLWGYAGLTGATPSVLRATVTFSLFCLADMVARNTEPVNSLAGAAFLLLWWDPLMIGQLSFQLSFLAVFGIALFYRPLLHLWVPPNLALHYFWSLCCVSIAAQLMTTPLALLSFQAFPVWFLPANMVVVGLVAVGVWGGLALLAVHWIPVLGEAATGFMVLLLRSINGVTDLFAGLPGAYPALRIDGIQGLGLYALVLLIAGWVLERWAWARAGTIALTAGLLVSWAWKAHERNATHRFIVYDQRDGLTCAAESGRLLTVFTDTLDHWTRRRIHQHDRAIGAAVVDTVTRVPESLELDGLRVRWLVGGRSGPDTVDTSPADVVLVADEAWADTALLRRWARPACGFVLAPALSAKRRAYLRRWCAAQGVPVHDVRTQGAYVR